MNEIQSEVLLPRVTGRCRYSCCCVFWITATFLRRSIENGRKDGDNRSRHREVGVRTVDATSPFRTVSHSRGDKITQHARAPVPAGGHRD